MVKKPKFKVGARVVVKAKYNTFRGVVQKVIPRTEREGFEYLVRWETGNSTEVNEESLKKSFK